VVGSWPEPFAQASTQPAAPVEIVCFDEMATCEDAASRFADSDVKARIVDAADDRNDRAIRVLVGPWARVRTDPAAAQIETGPATSGVFARFAKREAAWQLVALDEAARPVATPEPGDSGLIAALRLGDDPATWVVTGSTGASVQTAVGALDEDDLANRYAVVVRPDGTAVGIPEVPGG
jgi:hypothetical protein